METQKVISFITQLEDDKGNWSEPYYFAPEQRYVGPLPASNNNNLEEQQLIGVDKTTVIQKENNNIQTQITKFKRDNDSNGYYTLTITKYFGDKANEDLYIGNNSLILKENFEIENDNLQEKNYDKHIQYKEAEESLYLMPNVKIETQKLTYKNKNNLDINISTKEIRSNMDENGNLIRQEEIISSL